MDFRDKARRSLFEKHEEPDPPRGSKGHASPLFFVPKTLCDKPIRDAHADFTGCWRDPGSAFEDLHTDPGTHGGPGPGLPRSPRPRFARVSARLRLPFPVVPRRPGPGLPVSRGPGFAPVSGPPWVPGSGSASSQTAGSPPAPGKRP